MRKLLCIVVVLTPPGVMPEHPPGALMRPVAVRTVATLLATLAAVLIALADTVLREDGQHGGITTPVPAATDSGTCTR